MKSKIRTIEDVKNMLDVDDLRKVSGEKLLQFMSSLPDMDKDVAIECIRQFPEFSKQANNMVIGFFDLCKETITEENFEGIKAQEKILDDLSWLLKKDDISEEMRYDILNQMRDIGYNIERLSERKLDWKKSIIKYALAALSITTAILGAVLGVKISKD